MKRITQFILCIVLAVSAYGQGVGGNSVPRTVSGISAALDLISSTQGTVFYRGASGWEALPPGTSGQLFSTQGAAANPIWVTATGGAGDVNGPTLGTATDNAIVRFDGTGGKTVQNSAVTIADTTGAMTWATGQAATLTGGDNGASLALGSGSNIATLNRQMAFTSGTLNLANLVLQSVATNVTDKSSDIVATPYTSANTAFASLRTFANATDNFVTLGGGSGAYNAATSILFYTGATNNTLTGTEAARITPTRTLLIGTTTQPASLTGGVSIVASGSGATATGVGTGGLQSANFGLSTVSGGASYFGGAVTVGAVVSGSKGILRTGSAQDTTFTGNPILAGLWDTTAFASGVGGGFSFGGTYNAANASTEFGYIGAVKENATDGNYSGKVVIGARTNGAGAANMAALTILGSDKSATFAGAVTTNGNLIISRTGALADAKATLNGVGANGGAILELNSATGGNIYSYASHQQAGVEKWMTGMHASFSASGYIIRDSVNSVTVATFNAGATPSVSFGGVTILKNYTVATLPAAASYTYGTAFVSDATNAAGTGGGTAPTGGGAVKRLVYSDGTNWLLQ